MKNIDRQIQEAIIALKQGGIIIYPSESCYSFGCDAKNQSAVGKIHKIKDDNNSKKPMTILVSSLRQLGDFAALNEKAVKIAGALMPGQINLIVDKKDREKFNWISSSENGIAFRIPANKIALELIKKFGSPITTTTVNIHGKPSMYKIGEIQELFGKEVSAVIDVGDLDESVRVSTIFDTRTGKILREGPISEQKIFSALL
ncbi:MAG: L-threonylcarbamoyladenylate synthase [bacterium]